MNVYEHTQERIAMIFEEFDNIYVSFSGGKDSGVLLNLCIDYIRANNLDRKIGLFHIDYEAQYQMTTDYVDEVLSQNLDILEHYRICLPISAQCSTSMFQEYWIPWEREKRDIWVREMPEDSINESNHELDFFRKGMSDYELQEKFSKWLHKKKSAYKTCCLVGIRTEESLNRWRAIWSDKNTNKYRETEYSRLISEGVWNMYPIYDWNVSDIWVANAKFGWSYNKIYDLFYMAGLTPHQMRVASPFHDCGQENLKLYRVIDPNNWGRMVGRVNGVNFTGIYGGTTAMGWKSIKLPNGHTWESYMYFLLDTLPEQTKESYLKKLNVSINFWRDKGGALSDETIAQLRERGVEISTTTTNYSSKRAVRMEYLDDVDISNFREIPTFKRMCICIIKNDHLCKYMGFSQTKREIQKRQNIINKYKDIL